MSSVVISGDTSGAITVSAPAVAGTNTLTLQAGTGTNSMNTLATAVTASGTSIDFTGLPSWIKRITVMLSGVSTSGTSNLVLRAGTSGGIDSTNYTSNRGTINNTSVFATTTTTGFDIASFATAAILQKGNIILNNISGNVWVASGSMSDSGTQISNFSGTVSLAATLDRVRITTVNGTDTFDAGSINILYEG